MTIPRPTRRSILIGLGIVLALAAFLGLPWLSPERGVQRTWSAVLTAIEDNDRPALAALLGPDYRDGFDLDREAALELAATVRGQFLVCTVRRERPELVMATDNRAATARAVLRLGGNGTPVATAAIQASAASQTPTTFRFRRNSWKPWDWRLVSVENPDAARGLARFRREASSLVL
jgi:hypothetical protein